MLLPRCARGWPLLHFLRTILDQVAEHWRCYIRCEDQSTQSNILYSRTWEDTMTILSSMPPLPLTMPVYGVVPRQVPEASMKATKVPFDNGEASLVQGSDTMPVLRRRLQLD